MANSRISLVDLLGCRTFEPKCYFNTNSKNKVNIVALGDVGRTLALGLRLLGGDVISEIGLFDINTKNQERVLIELATAGNPLKTEDYPLVKRVREDELFNCDVLIFTASVGVPALDFKGDVRKVQREGNIKIIEKLCKIKGAKDFKGMVCVMSDPVDELAMDFRVLGGYEREQVAGFGLGVMAMRAGFFLEDYNKGVTFAELRVFGHHGEGLVVANSLKDYNYNLSRELTEKTKRANLDIRDLGYKPYIAPAISSGAISILEMIRGNYHYSSIPLTRGNGEVYFGLLNKRGNFGIQIENPRIPRELAEIILRAI